MYGGCKMNKIRVLIADDDAIIREGLKMIIETQGDLEFVCSVGDGDQAIIECRNKKPDIAILDIRMPHMDGIQAAEVILAENLSIPLLLTTFDEPELILRALKVGINGYILKNSPAQRILSAIRVMHSGGTVFQEDVLTFIRNRIGNQVAMNNLMELMLSPREFEIVTLIGEGLSNKKIGERLFLSNGTIRNNISTILEKLGLEHRTQIAIQYLKSYTKET